MTSQAQPARVRALDGLRGVAATVVLLHHVVLASVVTVALGYRDADWSDVPLVWRVLTPLFAGPQAVLVFFVLSGLVLAIPAARSRPFDPAYYYPSRLLRLYVPVWAALLFAGLLRLVESRHGTDLTWWMSAHEVGVSASGTAHDAGLLAGPDGSAAYALTSVLWSLRWEVLFSLLLPLFVWAGRRLARWPVPSILACVLVAGVGGGHDVIRYMPVFLIGTIIAFSGPELDRVREVMRSRGASVALVAAGVLLYGWSAWLPVPVGIAIMLGTGGATLILLAPLTIPSVAALLERKPVQWLGTRSFSLYLVHEPVVVAVAFWLGAPSLGVLIVPAVIAGLVAAELFYRVAERPSHRLARAAGAAVSGTGQGRVLGGPAQPGAR